MSGSRSWGFCSYFHSRKRVFSPASELAKTMEVVLGNIAAAQEAVLESTQEASA